MKETVQTRHLFVSNRSPFLHCRGGVTLDTNKAIGGLVSTMEPAFRRLGGLWIGSSEGAPEHVRLVRGTRQMTRCFSKAIALSHDEIELYYNGFANRALWPLCHSFSSKSRFRRSEWKAYEGVNQKFARAILEEVTSPKDVVWIHDYHLALTPAFVQAENPSVRIASFWHIPFPPSDVLAALPWRREVLLGLLNCNFIGFHLDIYARNFLEAVRVNFPDARIDFESGRVTLRDRQATIRAVPLGIDFDYWASKSASSTVAAAALRQRHQVEHLLIAVDRLDYTKGVLERLEALDGLLERRPDLRCRLALVQVAVPTRLGVPDYRAYAREVDRRAARINDRHGNANWRPVVLQKGMVPQDRLAALYRAADVACVTPLRDGMNLVAKEFVASRVASPGVLVLSHNAGVAQQFGQHALLVDPFAPLETARAIENAISLDHAERSQRMDSLRSEAREHDLSWWLESISKHIASATA